MNSPSVLRLRSAGKAQFHDQVLVLVDPEPLPRECLARVLQRAFSRRLVVAVADVGEINLAMGIPVVLGLLKVPSPYTLGTIGQRVKAFEKHLPGTPVIVMGCGSKGFALEAIKAGARGVLPITDPLRVAMAAVHLVLAGGSYYPQRLPSEVRSSAAVIEGQHGAPALPPPPLTPDPSLSPSPPVNRPAATDAQSAHFTARELDVLAALQRGRSNKWIAHQLNLSQNTVKVHISHIMRKLKATNRTQAVIHSQTQGPSADEVDPARP